MDIRYIKGEWQIKIMAVFLFIAHEKGFKFHAQPQTGAYSCLLNEVIYIERYTLEERS